MYHSPFHLIDPDVFAGGDDALLLKRRLGLEKRKLLAEFELAGTPTIVVQGRELQRQDLTELFDELQNEALLALHLRIWQHKAFLEFLETGHPGTEGEWLYPSGAESEANLHRFVSPLYAEALNRYLQRCIQGQDDPRSLLYELRADDWLLPLHQEEAYRYPTRFYTEKKNELLGIRYRTEQKAQVVTTELRDWCTDQQIHVLNRLPDRFDDLRYVLTELLNNLCVLYDRQQAKRHALAVIERAATIRVNDEELERLVPSNLRIIRNKNDGGLMQVDPDTGKRRVKFIPVLVLFVLLIRLIAAGTGCSESTDDAQSNMRRLPAIEMQDRSPEEESFGSLIAALATPEPFTAGDTLLDKPLQLRAPARTGTDPFAPLFADSSRSGETATQLNGTLMDSSTILLRNQAGVPAIFLLQLDADLQRSVYVAPGDAYMLQYPGVSMAVHVYAGADWSDTLRNSFLHYKTSTFATRQVFRGGFRKRLPLSGEATAPRTPVFAREAAQHGTQDTFTVRTDNGELQLNFNLGAD